MGSSCTKPTNPWRAERITISAPRLECSALKSHHKALLSVGQLRAGFMAVGRMDSNSDSVPYFLHDLWLNHSKP